MKSKLSATHLLQHLVLFAFIGVFLLTMARAAYVLWQFNNIDATALIDIFVMGLRYDIALVCIFALPALVFGSVFGMFSGTRPIAKFFVALLLIVGMLFFVLSELITPYFMLEKGVRPDLSALSSISDPVSTLASLWSTHLIPAIIGVVLATLVIIAYIARLELTRLLRFPLAPLSTIAVLIIGLGLCAFGIYSHYDPLNNPPLSPTMGIISTETVVNEIALNSGYKLLYSFISPFLPSS